MKSNTDISNPSPAIFVPYLFYLIILILPFEQLVTIYGFSLVKYVGLILVFSSVFAYRRYYTNWPLAFYFYLIYILLGTTVDLIRDPNILESLNEIIGPFLIFLLMIISYNLSINGKFVRIVELIFISSLILACYQLFLPATEQNQFGGIDDMERVSVLGTDPNFTASYIGLSILFGILVILKKIPVSKTLMYISIFAIPVAFFAILKTDSRGGLLATVMGVISIFFIYRGFKNKFKILLFLAIVFSFGTYFLLQNELFLIRIQSSFLTGEVAGRDLIWEKAIKLSFESPFFGYGNRMYLRDLGVVTGHNLRGTHNTFLAVLLATGWIGSFFFSLFYLQILKVAWKFRDKSYGGFLYTSYVLCFFVAMSINLEIAKWFWILLALCLSQNRVSLYKIGGNYNFGNRN